MTRETGKLSAEKRQYILDKARITDDDITYIEEQLILIPGLVLERVSTVLTYQLAATWAHRTLNTIEVLTQIRCLETDSPSLTKKPAPFIKETSPLNGFMHSHFFDASYMLQNIVNHWGKKSLDKMIDDEMNRSYSEGESWELRTNRLAHKICFEGWEEHCRQQKVTGEWIVYQEFDGAKFYLWLTTHKTGDQQNYESMRYFCQDEFPFLFPNENVNSDGASDANKN